VFAQGADLARFCGDVLERLRHLTVLAVVGRAALVDLSPVEVEELEAGAARATPIDLPRWVKILLDASADLARASGPRWRLEMAAVRMATLGPLVPFDELLERLESLEAGRGGAVRPTAGAAAIRMPSVPPASSPGATRRPAPPSEAAPAPRAPVALERGEAVVARPERHPEAGDAGPAVGLPDDAPEQQRWKALVDGLQREKASRFFRLSYSRVLAVAPDAIRVAVAGREAANALLEGDTRESIERAIEREFGKKLRFEPTVPSEA